MIRSIVYIAVLAVAVAAAAWLADQPGGIAVEWLGYKIHTEKAGLLVVLLLVVAIAMAIGFVILSALGRAPRRFALSRGASRRERGYKALTQGMVAVAAGDASEAHKQANKANRLLGDPPLTMLLSAQAAQLNGDEAAARNFFDAMLGDPETAFLGLRGLLIQAQRSDDRRAALTYAQRAYELRPKTPWVLTTLFDLQVGEHRWGHALSTLEDAIRQRAVLPEDGKRRKVAVLLGCSADSEQAGDRAGALDHARKAADLVPDFLPATLTLIRLLVLDGKTRQASRLIPSAWAREPHPELSRIYADIGAGEGPIKKVRQLEKLLSFNPEHVESHVALAAAALEAKLWGVARHHLDQAAGTSPPARVCRLMADLEESEKGDIAAARPWLLRAASADPDPAWVCSDCGAVWASWTPVCGKCGSLGSQSWSLPQRVAGGLLASDPAGPRPGVDDGAPGDGTTAQAPSLPVPTGEAGNGGGDGGGREAEASEGASRLARLLVQPSASRGGSRH